MNRIQPNSCNLWLRYSDLRGQKRTGFTENNGMGIINPEIKEGVSEQIRDKVSEPPLYKVLLHNDDYTTMEFVVDVLMYIFKKIEDDAIQIMLNVHKTGIGLCGLYTYEMAETKVEQVHSLANESGYPLKCTMEKE